MDAKLTSQTQAEALWEGDIMVLSGEIDLATAPGIGATVLAVFERLHRIELDLSRVSHMDSTGLQILVRLVKAAKGLGKDPRECIRIKAVSPGVARLLETTGLKEVLCVEGTT